MSTESFAGYLAGLDEAALAKVLQARPDVRIEPVPRGFPQLAQRLGGRGLAGHRAAQGEPGRGLVSGRPSRPFSLPAPTVLSSPNELDDVLTRYARRACPR